MIKELSASPKPQNSNSKILMSVFFILSAAVLIVSRLIDSYKGVVAFVGVLLLVSAILVYTKYVAIVFYYDVIITSDGEPLFVVRQLSGRREVTLCRVPLAELTDIRKETAAERRAHVRQKDCPLFVYLPTLFPPVSYRMTVGRGSERSEVLIECSEEFAALLLDYAAEARELAGDLNEE